MDKQITEQDVFNALKEYSKLCQAFTPVPIGAITDWIQTNEQMIQQTREYLGVD
ncbi:MAG: hypothetical protein GY853_16640 [PVC group bacterium]|nr:hypothetical protein [PVC group bacterium]